MKKLVAISSMALFLFAGQYDITGVRQSDLSTGSENLPKIEYTKQAPIPGHVTSFKKSFNDAPPMIPHDISGMTPIRIGQNQCIGCHMPQTAKAMGITAIPASHFKSEFSHKKGVLAGSRYNCTQCHAPQAKLDPVVQNKFESLRHK